MTAHTLRTLLAPLGDRDVCAVHSRWCGEPTTLAQPRREHLRALASLMGNEDLVQRRIQELPEKLGDLLEGFLGVASREREVGTILQQHAAAFQSRYQLELSLAALQREGFVFAIKGVPRETGGRYAVPDELATSIDRLRERQRVELRGTLSLKGFLQRRLYDPGSNGTGRSLDNGDEMSTHARRVYKIYLLESSIRNRIDGLPPEVRLVFDRALGAYGGLMPVDRIAQIADEHDVDLDLDLVRKCLEEAMLGTVAPLRLSRFGLEPIDQAVVVFYEITLSCLQDWSAIHDAPDVAETLSSGVDLLTNLSRFLRDIGSTKVQFTVEGNLYKASAKRITRGFLQIPGGYMPPEAQIKFLFRFGKSRRLVERSGERALRLSAAGQQFEQQSLIDKLRNLLAFAVEERAPQGEHYHQARLRRILLRLLRRLEPEQWHEALFVPFLARNGYVGKLDELHVEDFFAARFKGGDYVPSESAHQISLLLLDFVKRRMYPLGLVDLGLRDGRPVAIRLSRLGAELLGAEPAAELGGNRSFAVVNPDFEIIVFPGDDEHEVVHTFDQFCERIKSDHIHHFRISRHSVQAALQEGATSTSIVQTLTDRSRTPLPQNVLYSLEEWADQAGVLQLDEALVLRGRRAELLDRFCENRRLGEWVARRASPNELVVRAGMDLDDLCDVARDLGFLIERRAPESRGAE